MTVSAMVCCVVYGAVFGQDDSLVPDPVKSATTEKSGTSTGVKNDDQGLSFKIHGWGSFELGQLYNGHGPVDRQFQHVWRQRVYSNLEADLTINDRYHMVISPELRLYYPYPINLTDPMERDLKAKYDAYLNETYFGVNIGDLANPVMSVKVGYFKYKYNPDVRDLGEYMFRSQCYPDYIYNIFDQAYARLLGVQVSSDLFDSLWHQDLIINSETFFYPREDFALTYLTSLNLFKGFLTIGGGISGSHLFPVDPNLTTPQDASTNMYQKNRRLVVTPNAAGGNDTAVAFDSTYYSFTGTKVMGRFCIDPKAFFRDSKLFGPNDLRLYGEFCVLGWDNIVNEDPDTSLLKHPYENRNQRIPFMLGFNFPGFNFIDVISAEVQFWDNPFANEFYDARKVYVPQHYNSNGWGPDLNENTKWSIYIKKSFMGHFAATLAFARDNVFDLDETDYGPNVDFEETYRYHSDWYWRFKVEGSF